MSKEKTSTSSLMLSTQDQIANYDIVETYGLVRGNTVRSRNIGSNLLASLKTVVGGEIGGYTKMLTEAREKSMERMIEHAESMGANAVVGLRFVTSDIMQCTEMLAYGTAVKIKIRKAS